MRILLRNLVQLSYVDDSVVIAKLGVGGSLLLLTIGSALDLIGQLRLVNVHRRILGIVFLVVEVSHRRVGRLLLLTALDIEHLFQGVVCVKDLARIFGS